jgi:hypothetical protein
MSVQMEVAHNLAQRDGARTRHKGSSQCWRRPGLSGPNLGSLKSGHKVPKDRDQSDLNSGMFSSNS